MHFNIIKCHLLVGFKELVTQELSPRTVQSLPTSLIVGNVEMIMYTSPQGFRLLLFSWNFVQYYQIPYLVGETCGQWKGKQSTVIAEFLFWPAQPSDTSLTLSYFTQSVESSVSGLQEAIVSESLLRLFSVQQYEVTGSD